MRSIEERLWSKVELGEPDECWIWTASGDPKGYGRIWQNGRMVRVHRLAYELLVGPIPEETLDHLCSNRACVNPAHLEPVSHAENTRRGNRSGKRPRKSHCPRDHPYDEKNTYTNPKGERFCRTCKRERDHRPNHHPKK